MGRVDVLIHGDNWPGAGNTGPTGALTTQTTAGMVITDSGTTTLQNLDWTINDGVGSGSAIEIRSGAGAVNILNSKIKSNAAFFNIQTIDGYAGLLTVNDCELDGLLGPDNNNMNVANTLVQRCNIHGSGNDLVRLQGNVTFRDCWFHGPNIQGADPHFDCAQSLGCDSVLFDHCNFDLPETGMNSAWISTHGGNTTNVVIQNCLLGVTNARYQIYGGYQSGVDAPGSATGTKILNNKFKWSSTYVSGGGYLSPLTSVDSPDVTHSGNVWFDGPFVGQSVD